MLISHKEENPTGDWKSVTPQLTTAALEVPSPLLNSVQAAFTSPLGTGHSCGCLGCSPVCHGPILHCGLWLCCQHWQGAELSVPLHLPTAGPVGCAGSAAEMGPWGPFHSSKHKQTPLSAGSARGLGACGAPASSASLRGGPGCPQGREALQKCGDAPHQCRLRAQTLCQSHCPGSPLLPPPGCSPSLSSSSISIPFPHPCSPLQLCCPFAPSDKHLLPNGSY